MKSFFGLAALAVLFASCADPIPTAQQIPFDVWVSPVYSIVETGSTAQLYASVSGTNDRAVTWQMLTPGDTIGTLSPNGLYTAPLALESDSVVIKVRVSHNATGTSDTATISLRPGPLRLLVMPAAGTVYTYNYTMDTNGVKDPNADDTRRDTVKSVLNNEEGKDSVFHMKDERPFERLYRYEPNLDILAFNYGLATGQWLRMPFSSTGTPLIPIKDETVAGVRTRITIEPVSVGHEVQIFDSKRYEVLKVRVRTLETVTGGASDYTKTIDENFYFAASLGWMIRMDRTETMDQGGTADIKGEHWVLSKKQP